ncbi:MAG TPA: hypothetical protein VL523_01085, partial [Terriglobia bacterium]|nr:hypothetical protein [Terriglobia bacterium]
MKAIAPRPLGIAGRSARPGMDGGPSRNALCVLAVLWTLWGYFSLTAQGQTLAGGQPQGLRDDAEKNGDLDSGLYLEIRLTNPVAVSALAPGDTLEGKLSRDVYRGERRVFAAGSAVRVTVGKMERRRREPNDHWPGVVRLFAPRYESYPSFESGVVVRPDGSDVPLRVSLVSIGRKRELRAQAKKPGEAGVRTAQQDGQTLILKALDADGVSGMETSGKAPAAVQPPVTLAAGTQAQLILLGSLSASASH